MSSPQPVASPSPMSPTSNRQTAIYDSKTGGGGGVYVNPAYTKRQYAHPTAYYVFDMLFKLAIAGGIFGIVAILAIGVTESRHQTAASKKTNNYLQSISSLANDVDSIASTLSSISSNIGDIRNIMNRA